MGKTEQKAKGGKQKRRSTNSSNKYLKPGALAQIRYNKSKSCTDLGRKRVAVVTSNSNSDSSKIAAISTPVKFEFGSDVNKTPKTPRTIERDSDSRLESLPMDLLVKILCHLHHDQLRAVFHVSWKVRKAVIIARQLHFNYTTPDRSRQEMLNTNTPLPNEHWPFASKGSGKNVLMKSPHTPRAPKHGPKPPSRLKYTEMRQIAAVLFQESTLTPSNCLVPSVLPKPVCKSLASNRVLFYEDELCQAVAQNKLR